MEVRLLGEVAFTVGGSALAVRGARQRRLLAALALRPGEVVSADRLADAVWGEAVPSNPANALQAQVSALRKLLPAGCLVSRAGGYVLAVDPACVDIHRLERLVATGRELLGTGRPAEAAAMLAAALETWGPPLGDLADDDAFRAEVARLAEIHLAALETRIDADLAAGAHVQATADLEALTRQHPFRERFWVQRMVALYRSGRQAEALRAYAEARHHLVDELGIDPGPELRRTEALILAQDPSLDAPPAPAVAAAPRGSSAGNLRARLTRFVGREADVARLVGTLASTRLVTLVGPGGAGKTRLAVETGSRLAPDVADGVWLVELASVPEAAGVAPAVASALGVTDASARPSGDLPVDPTTRITRFLTGRAPLVLLDNCEHVVTEAALVADRLLAEVPGLRILATSREALGVPGEVLHPVAPLAVDAAVELFADRARAVAPTFDLDEAARGVVGDICRRLDGLPLSVELAAALLRAMTVRQLAGRLDDRFRLLTGGARTALPRQQTLRAVVDWSYDLLFEDERRLLWRLAAFTGGCRLEAAEAVCGDADLSSADIGDLLAHLVEKSLVVMDEEADGEPRYRQLQTLREYGRERLAESGEADVIRGRHAAWFLSEAVAAEEGLHGAAGPTVRRRIEAGLDDLRAALDWYAAAGDARSATRLATGIAWYWFLGAEYGEGLRWLRDALAVPGPVPPGERALLEAWASYYEAIVGDLEAAGAAMARAAAAAHADGTPQQEGTIARLRASSLTRAGRYVESLREVDRAEGLMRAVGHEWGEAMCSLLRANNLARMGRLADAEEPARRAVERLERLGEAWTVIEPLGLLAVVEEHHDDPAALETYDRVVSACRRHHLPGYLTMWLTWRGIARLRRRDGAGAVADLAEAVTLNANPVTRGTAHLALARAECRRGRPDAGLAHVDAAHDLFTAVGRSDADVVAQVARGLTLLDAGDTAAAADLAARCERANPAMAGLLLAAVAVAAGKREEARGHLARWEAAHVPAAPGTVWAALAADHAHLAAGLR